MEETNKILISLTIENWIIYLAIIAICSSLANSILDIINWYYQRKLTKLVNYYSKLKKLKTK